ncbi:helix-turn-helix domain-containing protein [Streptomyces sp. URMC 129]|uniref:helix-turn-helix domain-containing protein n=1 Tax=Streptomyces sp. URMC 129 TaxID=3423407 RepID=UPI003F1AE15D
MELRDEDGPTPRTMLSRQMRRAREAAGLSLRALGEQIHFPYGFLGRVERGEQAATESLVKALDQYFKADGLFTDLLDMAHELELPEYTRDYVVREREALRIQVFASSNFPALLQTESYARAFFKAAGPWKSAEQIEAQVAHRLKRQRVLDRPDPPLYWAIVDEAALKRPTPSRAVMRRQIEHVLKLGERPKVHVQVVPFGAMHPMLGGYMTLCTVKDGTTLGMVESFATSEPADSPKRIAELEQGLDVVRSMALREQEARDLFHHYLEEYKDEDDQ